MDVSKHAVLIVGCGPTGLLLAGELALSGVDVAIVERRNSQDLDGPRGRGIHPRTLEIFDQRGIAERFVARGTKYPITMFPGTVLNADDLPSRFNYWLAIKQIEVEQLLAEWVAWLKVPIYRGHIVTDFRPDDSGVDVYASGGRSFRADYLVGCDGGQSVVRKKAGITFPGWDPDISYIIFESDMAQEPKLGLHHGPKGTYALGRPDEGDRIFGVVTEQHLMRGGKPSHDDLRQALVTYYGTDFGVHNITWLSRFTDATRQASAYRRGRVLIAGDAAHVHSPVGGQGLNLGLLDAANLGWKLAQVVNGITPDTLLDTYESERHPVAARVLQTTMAMTSLNRGDARTNALREMMGEVMRMDGPRKWYAAKMSGLDIRYDMGDGHPLLGRRMPDLDITTQDGTARVFTLLHKAEPILLNFGDIGKLLGVALPARVRLIDATYDGNWELPDLGTVSAPHAVLIRPDGHVAWVGQGDPSGLQSALNVWFGAHDGGVGP